MSYARCFEQCTVFQIQTMILQKIIVTYKFKNLGSSRVDQSKNLNNFQRTVYIWSTVLAEIDALRSNSLSAGNAMDEAYNFFIFADDTI